VNVEIRVQQADFSVAAEYESLLARLPAGTGAVASFVGLVREMAGTDDVQTLLLEHYPGMTERSIGGIVDRAGERWPVSDVLVVHRVGELAPNAQIVLVQVASAHRAAAFAACEFIMDYLKTDAIFWKRETTSGGGRWVESTAEDRDRASAWKTG